MQAGLTNGQLCVLRDVFVGRCDASAFGDPRRVDVLCGGLRPKVLQRLAVDLGSGGRALVVMFRHAAPAGEVHAIEIHDAAGHALARLPRAAAGELPAQSLDALLRDVGESDALSILRGILGTSRYAGWRGKGAGFATTLARMIDFLSPPPAYGAPALARLPGAGRPAGGAPAVHPHSAASATRDEVHVFRAETTALLDDDILLFTGQAPWPLPPLGQASLGDPDQRAVPFRCLSLDQEPGEAGVWFVGLVRAPGLRSGAPRQLTVAGGDRRFRLLLGAPAPGRGDRALEPLRTLRPQSVPKIVDFLIAALARVNGASGCPAEELVRGLLLQAGPSSGILEIVGVLTGYGLLVQGWSRQRPADRGTVVIEGHDCHPCHALFATFARDDLGGDACGFVGLIEAPDLKAPADLQRVHLHEEAGWCHFDWLQDGQRLQPEITHDHLRAMLPRLEAEPATLRRIRRIANGGFDGRDTLSGLDRPVRMGFDFALIAPGGGLFLGGWLLDPTHRVDGLSLRSTAGMAADLRARWTRTARPDLNEAFAHEPLFAPYLSAEAVRHGFMAFIPRATPLTPGEEFYIEAALNDDSVHFMPVAFSPAEQGAVRRLLGSFDRNDPAASRLIERHIGPIVTAAGGPPAPQPDQLQVLDPAQPAARPAQTVIVPLGATLRDFDVNLASFAAEPDFADTQIVAVVPAALGGPAISALWHQASFYGLNLRLVVTPEALDAGAALEVGAGHADGDPLVLLSASTFARQRGWLGSLCQRFRALERPAVISPTLLYEDDSIKFAGLHHRPALALQPAEAITSVFAGYPRDWLSAEDLTPVLAATTECCVLSRATLRRVGGFAREFVTPELKSLDFMLRARRAGVTSFWLPTVEMVALDERAEDEAAYWFRNRRVIDEWSFGRKWSAYLADQRQAA
jgi:hypothetical protein